MLNCKIAQQIFFIHHPDDDWNGCDRRRLPHVLFYLVVNTIKSFAKSQPPWTPAERPIPSRQEQQRNKKSIENTLVSQFTAAAQWLKYKVGPLRRVEKRTVSSLQSKSYVTCKWRPKIAHLPRLPGGKHAVILAGVRVERAAVCEASDDAFQLRWMNSHQGQQRNKLN